MRLRGGDVPRCRLPRLRPKDKDGEDFELPHARLDEDADEEDEMRMMITLTPLLPAIQTFESEMVEVNAG